MEHYKNLSLEDIIYTDDNGVTCVEQWKDNPDYEGYYQISNLGRVKSLKRVLLKKNATCILKEKISKQSKNIYGYYGKILSKQNVQKRFLIHRLIAIAFIPNPKNLPDINHIDQNRENNKISNLEWVTHRENCCHREKNKIYSSNYIGVCFHKKNKNWRSLIRVNGKQIYLGVFNTEEEAYLKRLEYEKKLGIDNKYV
jgi:hypothetical protein